MRNLTNKNPFYFFLCLLATCLVLSCNNNDDDDDDVDGNSDPIVLDCAIDEAMVLANDPDKAVDYIVPCVVGITARVTVEEGTVIEFDSNAGFEVSGNGALTAKGSATSPIIMQGINATAGSWRGIYIETSDVNNQLDHVTIRHAGSDAFNSNDDRASIILYAGGKLSLTNSTLEMGKEFGLQVNYGGTDLTFSNNTITSHQKAPVFIMPDLVKQLDATSDYSGNSQNYIHVVEGNVTSDATWAKLGVPYRVIDRGTALAPYVWVDDNVLLTLTEGSRFEFSSEGQIYVEGALRAIGTAAEPIVFTGATEVPGAWARLEFASSDVRNQLDHVEISYAGGTAYNAFEPKSNIRVQGDAYLSLTNSVLRDGDSDCGIGAQYSGETIITTGTTFEDVITDICQ